ncbi:hypothetical protein D7S86_28310 [Pararobbsia silviterrae]|uniref:Uncharacterized protein n=1 Tax=Pararobbsia silviterrae TaxID=1792498 RepID=A0A494WZ26_9BURK|nr:hypothetical protein D7S86_28310 [Pararobbsia silviterrae]
MAVAARTLWIGLEYGGDMRFVGNTRDCCKLAMHLGADSEVLRPSQGRGDSAGGVRIFVFEARNV